MLPALLEVLILCTPGELLASPSQSSHLMATHHLLCARCAGLLVLPLPLPLSRVALKGAIPCLVPPPHLDSRLLLRKRVPKLPSSIAGLWTFRAPRRAHLYQWECNGAAGPALSGCGGQRAARLRLQPVEGQAIKYRSPCVPLPQSVIGVMRSANATGNGSQDAAPPLDRCLRGSGWQQS